MKSSNLVIYPTHYLDHIFRETSTNNLIENELMIPILNKTL